MCITPSRFVPRCPAVAVRFWVALLAVLVSGCLAPVDPAREPGPCEGFGHRAEGTVPGAWENVTGQQNGSWSWRHQPGVPVSPGVRDLLGGPANLTAVRWRVDGGPVNGTDRVHVSSTEGLLSPEYLGVRFDGSAGVLAPTLHGVLDPDRSPEDAARAVEGFLDQMRGPQVDNPDLAAAFAPVAQEQARTPLRAVDGSGGADHGVSGFPQSHLDLPEGPWALATHLSVRASAGGLRDAPVSPSFVEGPWRWDLRVPSADRSIWGDDASWWLSVDARDRVTVQVATPALQNGTAVLRLAEEALSRVGLRDADVAAFHLDLAGWSAHHCDPHGA